MRLKDAFNAKVRLVYDRISAFIRRSSIFLSSNACTVVSSGSAERYCMCFVLVLSVAYARLRLQFLGRCPKIHR